jgi:hypothetical protein
MEMSYSEYCNLLLDELTLLELNERRANRRHNQLMRIAAWTADICAEVDAIREFLETAEKRKKEIQCELEELEF